MVPKATVYPLPSYMFAPEKSERSFLATDLLTLPLPFGFTHCLWISKHGKVIPLELFLLNSQLNSVCWQQCNLMDGWRQNCWCTICKTHRRLGLGFLDTVVSIYPHTWEFKKRPINTKPLCWKAVHPNPGDPFTFHTERSWWKAVKVNLCSLFGWFNVNGACKHPRMAHKLSQACCSP